MWFQGILQNLKKMAKINFFGGSRIFEICLLGSKYVKHKELLGSMYGEAKLLLGA